MRLRAFVDPAVPVGDLCAGSFWESIRLCVLIELVRRGAAAPLCDFYTESLLTKFLILRTYCASPAAPIGDFCTENPAAPLGDFCTESLLAKTSILRTYWASPAAPVGDFCTESLLAKTSILRTYCASPAAPVGDFCTESLLAKTSILRTYCASPAAPVGDFLHRKSGCALRRLLRGVLHARVVSAAPRGDFDVVECRRPSMRSFRHWLSFLRGIFCVYIT
jgi:hypothetical protein